MNAAVQSAAIPVLLALTIVAVSALVSIVIGKAIHLGDENEPRRFEPFAPLDFEDDGADVPFASDAAIEQARALANCRPLAAAVIDELAQRRRVTS